MSLLNKASLIQIPSGYKDGTLYSAKPTNGDGDFTFSRGSNLAATRINSEGLIEKGRENLLLQSNSFDTTWTLDDVSVTSGQSGYDGSNDAWKLESTDSGRSTIEQSISLGANIVQTFSVYAKSGNVNFLKFIIVCSGSNSVVTFDLSDGSSTSTNNEIDVKSENVGNDWYRLSLISAPDTDMTSVRFEIRDSEGSPNSAVGSFVYIQSAQLELGLVSTDVITTTTTTEQAGILEDMPRLDYSGGATCPSLLLEPQRSNLIDYSEYFGAWIKSNITVGDNVYTSPEGVQNAATIDVVSDSSFASVARTISVSANSTHTMSLFVKKETSETNYMGLGFVYTGGTTDVGYVIIDSVNGTAISADPRIDVITNVVDFGDYWRVEATATDSGSNTSLSVYVYATLSLNGTTVQVGTGSTRTIYGAMLEAASYPTSYIPTYGASVTRAGDACSKTGISSLIGQTEGTLFVEMKDLTYRGSADRIIGISDGTKQNRVILLTGQTSDTLRAIVTTGNVLQTSTFAAATFGNVKLALAYSSAGGVVYANGSQVLSFGAISVPTCSALYIQMVEDGTLLPADGKNTQALLFKTRLSNDELATLTTL